MVGAHWIVGIREINQFCIDLACLGEKRCGILEIIAVRHLVQHAAKPVHVVIECRIRPVGGDNGVALIDEKPHQIAQQTVDTFAHNHVIHGCGVMRCNGGAQLKALGVTIHPMACLGHGLDRLRRWAKDVLVGA